MEFLPDDIALYIEAHTTAAGPLLDRLERETWLKVLMPRMVSGHYQGQVLRMISRMIRPRRILEIGTFTGYSAICLADGLQDNGKLITIDVNEELEQMVRRYLKEAGKEEQVDYRVGNALEIIPGLEETFDLVFIDADKENNARYYDMVFDKVPAGGYILIDNVLWSGKVVQEKADKDTRLIQEMNDKVQADERVDNVLLPIRDGLLLVRKK